MSVEEEQARQRNTEPAAAASTSASAAVPNTENVSTPRATAKAIEDEDMEEDDPLLAQAIAMSTEAAGGAGKSEDADMEGDDEEEEGDDDDEEEEDDDEEGDEEDDEVDEEEAIAQAIAMSMKAPAEDDENMEGQGGTKPKAKK